MRKSLITLTFLLTQLFVFAQKEWSNWYSDGRELITFKNGFAQVIKDYVNPIPPVPPFENYYHFYYYGRGGISYSDPATGDLKFIVSNRLGFSSDLFPFPNDTALRSCPDQNSYHIIPFTNDTNKFYIIQFQSAAHDLAAQESGLQVRCPNAVGLGYSIVDLSKNGGKGDIIITNQIITGGLTEHITLVRHGNGKDTWIIVHRYGNSAFEAILATDQGFAPAVVSNIGPAIASGSSSVYGPLTASHDGKILASAKSYGTTTGTENDVQLYDFDNNTGLLSNYRSIPSDGHVHKLKFSPDNSKLYSAGFDYNYKTTVIKQWDFNQPDIASSMTVIQAVRDGSLWDMQLAPNGQIYISSFQEYSNNDYHNYLMAIQCPNLPHYACNFKLKALEVGAPAFPDLVNDFINMPRVTPPPKFSIGNDTAICFGSLTLTAPGGWESYKWNTGETTQQITVTRPGTYYVITGSLGFSCPSGYGYINVGDKAAKLDLGKDTNLCAKTYYPIHITDDYSNILWNNGSNARDSMIYGGGANTIISARDMNGCYTDDTIVVNYKSSPWADFGSDTVLCNNETLELQLRPYEAFSSGAIYLWQNNSTHDTLTVRAPGTYWGKVIYDGCTVSDTIKVSYVSGEAVHIGNDTTLCIGDSLLIQSSISNATYFWSTGETTASIWVKYPGQYRLTVTNGNCSLNDTIQVQFNPKPLLHLGNDTAVCEGTPMQLSPVIGPGDYLWQDGSKLNYYNVTKAGLYWLKFAQDGCAVADSIFVQLKQAPALNVGKDTGICAGTSFTINAYNSAIQQYIWQDQSTLSSIKVSNAGNYWVTVTGSNGCINKDTVSVALIPAPVFNLGVDTALCDGKVLDLKLNVAGAGYLWNDGTNANNFRVAKPGLFWVQVNQQGCVKSDSIVISYKPNPSVNLGSDTILCEGVIKELLAKNAGAVYLWQDGSTNQNYIANNPGLYHVAVQKNGCNAADSIYISYTPKPMFTLGNDTFLCKGQLLELHPLLNTDVQYRWQDGSNFSSFTVKDTGVYALTVYNECGTASSSIKIDAGVCQLYLPTAFTPNNDNLNDIFRVRFPFAAKQFHLQIFNRFGEQVFETTNMSKGWNGSFKGEQQPAGAYIWNISLIDIDGKNKTVRGSVLLIR